jgi:hypothetical protein
LARFGKVADAVLEERTGGGIKGDGDVLAGPVASGLDGLDDQFAGFLVAAQIRCEAAFVADRGGVTLFVQDFR